MSWSWTAEAGIYALRPEPRPPGVLDAGFWGRSLRPDAPDPLAGRDRVTLDQVHGARVARCDAPGLLRACDGAVTSRPGLVLTVRTADCLPVLIIAGTRGLALLHAGWRGLAAGVLEAGVRALGAPRGMEVWIGPAIGACCYEVGPEVAAVFPETALDRNRGPRPHLDLVAAAAHRLAAVGIPAEAVRAAPVCTRCHQHLLPSARGSGAAPERALAFAALAPPGGGMAGSPQASPR